MDNAGCFPLAAQAITAPLAGVALAPIAEDLDGMAAVTLEFVFGYGSGGTTCSAVVQTRLGAGATWRDIARADFAQASAIKYCVVEASAAKAIAAYAALVAEGVNDGLLGDALQVVVTSTGVYANTTLAVNAAVR